MNKITNGKILILLISIFAIGIAILWWVANSTERKMSAELLTQAKIAARAIKIQYVTSLSGSENDLKKPAYQRIKTQLASMRTAIEKCRFLYLIGRRSDGVVFFFVDSFPPDSKDYAPPGLVYDEVSDSYIRTFEDNKVAVVGPVSDRWGTLITALVPLRDPYTGNIIAVLGMDIEANYWNKEILSRCFFPFIVMLLFVFLMLLVVSRGKVVKSLRQSENKLRATLDATPFPVALVDLNDDKIIYWSRSALALFGHTAPTSQEWYQIAYPDPDYRREVFERWKPFLEIARKSKQPVDTGRYQVTCKDGSVKTCEIFATFLSKNLIVTFNDITERKRQEKQLLSLEKRNQALLDYSPVCHKIVDLDFNLQYMSANGFKMLKIDNNFDVYGKPYPFYFFPEAFKDKMTENLIKVKNTRKTITLEALTNDIEGNEVWLDSSLIPVFNEEEKIDFITVVSADVTQRKLDETAKERLEEQLRQAHKMEAIGNLAGGIAHDFNNILAVILGNTELAVFDIPDSDPAAKSLKAIHQASLRAKDMVQQLLAFSRKSDVKSRPFNMTPIVK